jgi:hypothetical protein
MDEMRRLKLDCFRMCFRIKVQEAMPFVKPCDSKQFERHTIISFVKTTKAMLDSIEEGSRYRFYNVKPECFYRDSYRLKPQSSALLLQFQNGKSSFENCV